MDKDWPFDQPKNAATLTVEEITSGQKPILLVSHHSDDHGWVFLTGEPFSMASAQVVALLEIVKLDQTVLSIADLPPGWSAARDTIGGAWRRYEEEDIGQE